MELTQNSTLNPNIRYFKQQLTSLVSLRYFLTGILDMTTQVSELERCTNTQIK